MTVRLTEREGKHQASTLQGHVASLMLPTLNYILNYLIANLLTNI